MDLFCYDFVLVVWRFNRVLTQCFIFAYVYFSEIHRIYFNTLVTKNSLFLFESRIVWFILKIFPTSIFRKKTYM